jgi:hypothetical protein
MSMVCWNDTDGKTEVLGKKKFPVPVLPTKHLNCGMAVCRSQTASCQIWSCSAVIVGLLS